MAEGRFTLYGRVFEVTAPTEWSDEVSEVEEEKVAELFDKLETAAINGLAEINPELRLAVSD
jgi:hypothetical protein